MYRIKIIPIILISSLACSACKKQEVSKINENIAETDISLSQPDFTLNLNAIPISHVVLNTAHFPYIQLPKHYTTYSKIKLSEPTKFPFFVHNTTQWVESHSILFQSFRHHSHSFINTTEIQKYFADEIQKLGGIQISFEKIPTTILETWENKGLPKTIIDEFKNDNIQVTSYIIRNPHHNIWISLLANQTHGSFIVVDQEIIDPALFEPTTANTTIDHTLQEMTVDAATLKRILSQHGKIDLMIKFISTQSNLDPISQAQIDEIAKYLLENPAIKLEINGHAYTDGDTEKNRILSESRAKVIVNTLMMNGISAERLKAQGFGDTQPNHNQAKNQRQRCRIELVVVQ